VRGRGKVCANSMELVSDQLRGSRLHPDQASLRRGLAPLYLPPVAAPLCHRLVEIRPDLLGLLTPVYHPASVYRIPRLPHLYHIPSMSPRSLQLSRALPGPLSPNQFLSWTGKCIDLQVIKTDPD
jgi:hypothetical protein